MSQFIFALILGIGAGGLYAMLGAGIVAAFKGSGVINFAHGAVAMYAAYTWSELRLAGDIKLPWFDPLPTDWLNVPVTIGVSDTPFEEVGGFWGQAVPIFFAMLMAGFLGVMLHYLVFRPLRNSPALAKVIGSVGAMLWLQSIAQLNFGSTLRTQQGFLPAGSVQNFLGLGGNLGTDRLWILASALALGGGVSALYRYTSFGLATRAADENEKGATLLGYSPQRLALMNWVLASLMAGVAGLLYVGIATLTPTNYSLFVIPALTAALLGNLQSIWIATLAGIGLGMVQSGFADLALREWWPEALPPEAVRALIPLVVVVGFLYWRGDKLPVRGSLGVKGQPRAPENKNPYIGAAIGAVAAVIAIGTFTSQWEVAFTASLVLIPIMLSYVVLTGYLGQISLAQLSLAGVAAFAMIRFASDGSPTSELSNVVVDGLGLPDPLAIVLGIASAVVIGMLIAVPALRIRGVQLAVVTIVAIEAIDAVILRNESVSGPGAKANNPVPRPSIFGWDVGVQRADTFIPDRWQFAVFALICVVVSGLIVANVRRGGTGRRFLAIRSNERAAAAAGIDVARNKLLGFAIAAALAGVGGILTAYKLTNISAENYNVFVGIAVLAFAYLGGITMVSGSVIGGLLGAGGLMAFFIAFHFDDVTRDYFTAVGALGLVLNAIITNGEGIAMLSRESNQLMLNFVKYADRSDWRRLVVRIGPTIVISVVLGYVIWTRHDHFHWFWMSLVAIWLGLNIRGLILGINRVRTKTGGMFYVPPPDSPAWGPKGAQADAGDRTGSGPDHPTPDDTNPTVSTVAGG